MNFLCEPIFKKIFAADWRHMPAVFHKHYANCAYSNDIVVVEGHVNIMCKGFIKLLKPLFLLLGSIPPFNAKHVPITVVFTSERQTNILYLNRMFYLKKPYQFCSKMVPIKNHEVIEIMRWGIGWRIHYAWQDNKVVLSHKGYVIRIFGCFLPVPITWLLGRIYAEEQAINDNTFSMSTHISHPLWGRMYEYKGHFRMVP